MSAQAEGRAERPEISAPEISAPAHSPLFLITACLSRQVNGGIWAAQGASRDVGVNASSPPSKQPPTWHLNPLRSPVAEGYTQSAHQQGVLTGEPRAQPAPPLAYLPDSCLFEGVGAGAQYARGPSPKLERSFPASSPSRSAPLPCLSQQLACARCSGKLCIGRRTLVYRNGRR